MTNKIFALCVCLILSSCHTKPSTPKQEEAKYLALINWRNQWNDDVFEQAQKSQKPILLSLEARWCHWCHVMTEETYTNPQIVQLLNDRFITVRIDQDTNSYLSNRYKNYGWPATIIFNPQGSELLKQAGYIEASELEQILKEILSNPNQQISSNKKIKYSETSTLSAESRQVLEKRFINSLDLKLGGLKTRQKYIERDTLEYALHKGFQGDADSKKFVKLTLTNASQLLDSEFGGVYQYSTKGNWSNPHYEKLTEIQAEYIRIYSLGYLFNQDPDYLNTINKIFDYSNNFLSSPEGAFYSSQDADLIRGHKATRYFKLSRKERLKLGVPPIDRNVFTNKNGMMIEALLTAYRINADTKFLNRALKAYKAARKLNYRQGYYIHSTQDPHPYLADNLFMARAELALYQSTASREYLGSAIQTARYIIANFKSSEPGYLSISRQEIEKNKINSILKPEPILSENIKLLRFLNLLFKYSGDKAFKLEAESIMRYLGSKDLIQTLSTEPGILIANQELNEDPVHFTIVGHKNDLKSKELFKKSLKYPSSYIRVECFDPKEGRLLNHDVEYPILSKPAAFRCVDHSCSLPIYDPRELID